MTSYPRSADLYIQYRHYVIQKDFLPAMSKHNCSILLLFFFFSVFFICSGENSWAWYVSCFKLSLVCVYSHLHRQTFMAWAVSFPFLSIVSNVSSSLTAISLPCEITKWLIRNCSFLPYGALVNLTHAFQSSLWGWDYL